MDDSLTLPQINMISQQEFCDHIEDDDFLLRYGNPVAVKSENGQVLICMAVAYYERMTLQKIELKSEE